MNKTKKIIGAVLIVAGALTITGCAARVVNNSPEGDKDTSGNTERLLYQDTITLDDGRKILCVEYANGYEGGLSCDWAHPLSGGN